MRRARHVKVFFALDDEADAESESLWARPGRRGNFVLENVPFHVPGVALGDEIAAEGPGRRLWATAVVHDGGHATVWVEVMDEREHDDAVHLLDAMAVELESLGALCEIDDSTPRLAIDLTRGSSAAAVVGVLFSRERAGDIEFAVPKTTRWMERLITEHSDGED